jgi:hypothetical protein
MDKIKRATFDDLIARKIQKEKDQLRTKEIYVTSMGASLIFKNPSDNDLLDMLDEIGSGDTSRVIAAYKKLIYLCCPQLQDTKLHEELEVVDPFDTVDKLFDLVEVMSIGEELSDFIDVEGKIEVVKNS